jgi:hypothetical protein
MRPDMFKVIVERPRSGHSDRSITSGQRRARLRSALGDGVTDPRWRAPDPSNLQPIRPRPGTKYLSENLRPLERFLARNVGRPWSKVYAEISEHLTPRNAVQQHVRDHLRDFVSLDVRLVDGELIETIGRFRRQPGFYVCPKSGLLKAWPRRARPRRRWGTKPDVELVEGRALRQKQGIWFEVILAPLPDPELRAVTLDVILGVSIRGHEDELARRLGRAGVYAAAERQLGKRELRRLKSTSL